MAFAAFDANDSGLRDARLSAQSLLRQTCALAGLSNPAAECDIHGLVREPMLQRFQHLYQSSQGASPRLQTDEGHAADTSLLCEGALREMAVPTSAEKLRSERDGGCEKVTNLDLAWLVE